FALTTPGFTSQLSINALLNAISFIGCVAVGMTFITLTGNIMSLCLGATLSASALIFLSSLSAGILAAFLLTLMFGIVVTAAMVGSNARAATAAGISTAAAVTFAYVIAGACAAVSGILLAARYGSGDMELGTGYDYTAIAAVLVGGTAIQGGSGSVVRTLIGV